MATTSTTSTDLFGRELRALGALAEKVASTMEPEIQQLATRVVDTLRGGGTLFFCGNGGSAADAQHMATEYVIRYRKNRIALPAIALTTDTSLITAAANDLGFETIFARQVEALARPGDLVIFHSTSGNSPNLSAAAHAARRKGVATVALLAKSGGVLRGEVDWSLTIPTESTSHAQEVQLAIQHLVCEYAETTLGVA